VLLVGIGRDHNENSLEIQKKLDNVNSDMRVDDPWDDFGTAIALLRNSKSAAQEGTQHVTRMAVDDRRNRLKMEGG